MCFSLFYDTATTYIYSLSLHDALPICRVRARAVARALQRSHAESRFRATGRGSRATHRAQSGPRGRDELDRDRKSTRLNSSHTVISYAVFCLKKKKKK